MFDAILGTSDIEQFITRGYVRVRGCFSRELARDLTTRACERLYCSLDDPATWPKGRMRPPESQRVSFESIAPKAWQAACELIGGARRVLQPCTWGDGFIINFGGQDELAGGWVPPSVKPQPAWSIWHKDGDFFRHFLDSPEQGLLVIGIFSDIEHRGGATFVACDSVGRVARYLAARPEGVLPPDLLDPVKAMVEECSDFVETTGEVGDVYFLHPFMAHSHSQNASPHARFIINPPVMLAEPMCFARERPEDYSPVERGVLHALGVERYEFTPAHPRERVVPKRLAVEKQIWEERERLARQAQM
jgi:hypothetical protein